MFRHVKEFHDLFCQPVMYNPNLPDKAQRDLRKRLLEEEVNEFCMAYASDDLIEMADGLGDICYIVAGTCLSYGIWPQDSEYMSPYEGVIDKMEVFVNLNLDEIIQEDFGTYLEAEVSNDIDAIRLTLMQVMTTSFGLALNLGIPLNTVFKEIHRSNMSKSGKDGPIFREDGKIMKGENYSPPDIASILNK